MKDYTLTLSGSAQRLSVVLPDPTVGGRDDIAFRSLWLQPDGATANPMFLGSSSAVSATSYGVRLPASSGGVPAAPTIFEYSGEGPLKLSRLWVFGTSGEKLHILGVPF